jgi:hypothetical protein
MGSQRDNYRTGRLPRSPIFDVRVRHLGQVVKETGKEILGNSTQKFQYSAGGTQPKYIKETTSYKFHLAQDTNYIPELFRHDTFYPARDGICSLSFSNLPYR